MVDGLPLRIFLASPGDSENERAAVRACVVEHNAGQVSDGGLLYEVVEWDRIRGTARRPQEAINELIAESHFMIALFKGSWGSAPGSPWGYTSGTEEELFTGLLELGQADQPMRDVWLGFMSHPAPDDRITQLHQEIVAQHSVLFESFSGLRDLKAKLGDRLRLWGELTGPKIPRHVDLLPSSGKDVLGAASRRIRGQKLIELGQTEAGSAALHEAAVLGGPVEKLALASFLRRTGDLDGAYAQTQRAIDYLTEHRVLYSSLAAEAFSAQARVLSAQGQHFEAIGRLEHALTLVVGADAEARAVRCRIHDDLGLTLRGVNDLIGARRHFETGLEIRRESGREQDVCQSLINLARLEVAVDDLATAAEYVEEVISTLRDTPPSGVRANAEVLAAQVRLRQGSPSEGVLHAEWALAINRQIGNRRGEAIALLVLAQCCRVVGRHIDAESHARACLELNESMRDPRGAAKARWLLEHLWD